MAAMNRLSIAAGLILLATPAVAQWVPDHPYRGQWSVTKPNSPRYEAVILIDRDGRVTVDSPNESATYVGYVKSVKGSSLEFVVTNRKENVATSYCTVISPDVMTCYTVRQDKSVSSGIAMLKVGPGPEHLATPAR